MSVTVTVTGGGVVDINLQDGPVVEVLYAAQLAVEVFTSVGARGPQGEPGPGDMNKSVYDTNNDGVVDNSERLAGYTPTTLIINGGYF